MTLVNIINTDKVNIDYKIKIYYVSIKDDIKSDRTHIMEWKNMTSDNLQTSFTIPNFYSLNWIYVYIKDNDTMTKFKFYSIPNQETINFTFHNGTNNTYVRVNNQTNYSSKSVGKTAPWLYTIFCFFCCGCLVCGDQEAYLNIS